MSIYSGGDKYYKEAGIVSAATGQIEQEMFDREFRRNYLQDIRQARLAQAAIEWGASSTSEDYGLTTTSGTGAAMGNVFSNFSGAIRYSAQQAEAEEMIAAGEMFQSVLEKKGKKADKRAATATQITMAAAAVVGGFIGAAALGGVAGMSTTTAAGIGVMGGAAVGKAGISAMSPGRVARKTSTKAAVNYGIAGATMAAGGMMSGGPGAGGGNGIQTAGGISKDVTTVGGQTSFGATTAPTTNTSWMSSLSKYKDLASAGQTLYNGMKSDDIDEESYYKQNNRQRTRLYTIRARRYS